MASTATQKKHTYEDYLKTPEDVRYELIEGDLLMTPSPGALGWGDICSKRSLFFCVEIYVLRYIDNMPIGKYNMRHMARR